MLNVDKKFNGPGVIKNTAHVHFNDKNLYIARFEKVKSYPGKVNTLQGNNTLIKA